MKELHIDNMKIVPDFAKVPDEQLQWLINQGETLDIEEGELLFDMGEPVDQTFVVLDGRLRLCTRQSGKEKEISIMDTGQITGLLPYSRATVAPVFCEAIRKSWLFKCPTEKIKAGIGN